jgi:tripartite-type tricarboxylate transporter receptor subunit TctC
MARSLTPIEMHAGHLSRRSLLAGGAALAGGLALGAGRAAAQQPGAIRLVVGFAAGGGVDLSARLFAQAFQSTLSSSVIVDNRPGAGSTLGVRAVVEAPPDGSVGLYASSSGIAVAPAIYKNLPYDPRKDLTPVDIVGFNTSVLVVRNGLPARTLAEFIDYAKTQAGALSFGSSGVGGGPHLQGYRFLSLTGTKATHVPYRGGAQALTDLVANRFDFMIDFLGLCLPQITAGNVRALAVIARRRTDVLPDVPTMQEAGLPAMQGSSWDGIFLPPNTPRPIVERWIAAVKQAKADPGIAQKIAAAGSELASMPSDQFAAFVASEVDRWKGIAAMAGIEPI